MGLDMEGSGRLRSEWNRTLLSDVCTAAYAQLQLRATTQLGPSSDYYALFPAAKPNEPWNLLVTKLYEALSDVRVLHTRAVDAGGRGSDGRWVTPREALYRDEEFARGAALTSALVSEGLPVVEPPLGVRALLLEHAAGGQATVCTPALVRAHLRGGGAHRGLERREDALTFLEYCLEDVLDDEAGDHLVNLQLVPLSNGALGRFARRSGAPEPSATDFALPSSELEARLLGGVPHRVVDRTVEGPLGERLRSIAVSGGTNIRVLSAPLFGQLMSEILPLEWRGKRHVAWEVLGANAELDPSEQERELRLFTQRDEMLKTQSGRRISGALVVELARQPSVNWLSDLWLWLGEHSRGDVRTFSDWPLLPVSDGGLCQSSLSSAVVGPGWEGLESGAEGAPSVQEPGQSRMAIETTQVHGSPLRGLVGVLKKLGCRFLHRGSISVSEHPLASHFLHNLTAAGILSALSSACENDGGGPVSQRVAQLAVSERAALRRFFAQPKWWSGAPGQPSSSSVNILRSLPIFETYGPSAGGLVALASSRVFLPPKDVDEALLGESFLRPSSETEARVLSGSLGVPVIGRAAFYRGHVFGRILGLPADVRNKTMLAALRDLPGLCSEDASFREIISRLPFVPAGGRNGEELLPPSALYDPRVEELVLLLEGARIGSESKPPAPEGNKSEPLESGSENGAGNLKEPPGVRNGVPTSSGFFPRGEFATPQLTLALLQNIDAIEQPLRRRLKVGQQQLVADRLRELLRRLTARRFQIDVGASIDQHIDTAMLAIHCGQVQRRLASHGQHVDERVAAFVEQHFDHRVVAGETRKVERILAVGIQLIQFGVVCFKQRDERSVSFRARPVQRSGTRCITQIERAADVFVAQHQLAQFDVAALCRPVQRCRLVGEAQRRHRFARARLSFVGYQLLHRIDIARSHRRQPQHFRRHL